MREGLRLLVVSGTRADAGLWLPILREAALRDGVEASVLATAMHLDPRFGSTIDELRASGFSIAAEVPCTPAGDSLADMAAALGVAVAGMAPVVEALAPDWLVVLGDRGEQLAAGLVASHLGIAIAHLHGGEVTRGAVDDTLRDLVTRVAHLHLPATDAAAARIESLGEEHWRIRVVGAPGLDLLREEASRDLPALRVRYGLGDGPYLLVVQHPETVGLRDHAADLEATLQAVRRSKLPALALFPNADAGGRTIVERLGVAAKGGKDGLRLAPSLPRPEYVTLLAGASALVGNSSSGIIEAPMLGIPAVNIGARQAGRTRGDNVIDVEPEADAIAAGLHRALDPAFRKGLSGRSPYGDGGTATRVVDALVSTPRDERLLVKRVGDG